MQAVIRYFRGLYGRLPANEKVLATHCRELYLAPTVDIFNNHLQSFRLWLVKEGYNAFEEYFVKQWVNKVRSKMRQQCVFILTQSQVPPEQWSVYGTTDPVIRDVRTNNGLESNNNNIKTVFLPQGGVGIAKVCDKMSRLFAVEKHKLTNAIKKVHCYLLCVCKLCVAW